MKRDYVFTLNFNSRSFRWLQLFYRVSYVSYVLSFLSVAIGTFYRLPALFDFLMITFWLVLILYVNTIFNFYQNLFPQKVLTNSIINSILIFCSLLFSPVLLYNLFGFFDDFNLKSKMNFATLTILTVASRIFLKISRSFNLKDLRYVFKLKWIKNVNQTIETNHFKFSDIPSESENSYYLYTDKESIQNFQKTYNCSELNAVFIEKQIRKLNDNFRVLDIGGAEGGFTSHLLRRLQIKFKIKAELLHLVDPIDLSSEYRNNLKEVVPSEKIKFSQILFQKFPIRREGSYDLLIASHSLYQPIDSGFDIGKILSKLDELSELNTSRIVIVLSSMESRAYNFKEKCLKSIFGIEMTNVVSETFTDTLKSKHLIITQSLIDNFFDFSEIVNDNDRLVSWLSYFLRISLEEFNDEIIATTIQLLKDYLQPLYELDEEVQNKFKNVHQNLNDNSCILTHKSEIIIYNKLDTTVYP